MQVGCAASGHAATLQHLVQLLTCLPHTTAAPNSSTNRPGDITYATPAAASATGSARHIAAAASNDKALKDAIKLDNTNKRVMAEKPKARQGTTLGRHRARQPTPARYAAATQQHEFGTHALHGAVHATCPVKFLVVYVGLTVLQGVQFRLAAPAAAAAARDTTA